MFKEGGKVKLRSTYLIAIGYSHSMNKCFQTDNKMSPQLQIKITRLLK